MLAKKKAFISLLKQLVGSTKNRESEREVVTFQGMDHYKRGTRRVTVVNEGL